MINKQPSKQNLLIYKKELKNFNKFLILLVK
nr:MAG TPA: hypothetical protein [Caudoviricetes sp.]